ncbi:MAG: ABC transporter ATP-binding protein [Planctomycetota bacterium]|nr:ABC transporter ATP-binding protein [Planctomycetota bacterium]
MADDLPKPRYGDFALYGRLWRQAKPYWGHLGLVFLLSLIAAPLALLMPLPLKLVVDNVLGNKPLPAMLEGVIPASIAASPESLLMASVITIVVVALLIQVHELITWVYKTWVGERLVLGFRARLFDHLQRLSLGFHAKGRTADSTYRLQFDAPSIQSVSIYGVIPTLTAFIKVVALVYVTARIDLTIALIAIAGGPVLLGLTQLYRGPLRRRWSAAQRAQSAAMSVVQESLGAVRVVKAFGQEERENERYRQEAERGAIAAVKAVRAHGVFDLLVGVATGIGAAVILYVGARHVQDGVITLGELLLVMAYLSQLFTPLREMGTRLADMQKGLASAERVFGVLDAERAIEDRPDAQPLERAAGGFTFDGVTFGYDEDHPVFENVNLEIPAGSRVGIAGRTGSGKSTLLSLLPRFYDPQQGTLRLDGIDVRDIRLGDLRRQFGIMPQEAVLFSTTIRENIAYGRPGATEEEIIAAAKNAAAHDFIAALPDGYDTKLGERGVGLSGGERQRVSLARAFLQDAPVLLLDEPTSALDTDTETAVMDAVERLMQGRTAFIIAHRLSTLEGCDIRLQIEDRGVERRDDVADMVLE